MHAGLQRHWHDGLLAIGGVVETGTGFHDEWENRCTRAPVQGRKDRSGPCGRADLWRQALNLTFTHSRKIGFKPTSRLFERCIGCKCDASTIVRRADEALCSWRM